MLCARARFAVCLVAPMLLACSGEPLQPLEQPRIEAPPSEPKVVGGKPAQATEIFGTVALWDNVYEGPICTGTLVAPTVIITAAHCVYNFDENTWEPTDVVSASELGIVAGALDARTPPPGTLYQVATVTPHPSYGQFGPADEDGLGNEYDIAVLTLASPVTTLQHVEILPPDQVDATLLDGTSLVISGYGLTSEQAMDMGELYVAETPYRKRSQWEFIAGAPGSPDTCNGDSGGPAYARVGDRMLLAGTTSRATYTAYAMCGDGGIYTLVPAFLDFVVQSAGGAYPAPPPQLEPEQPEAERPGTQPGPETPGARQRSASTSSGCAMSARDGGPSAWLSLCALSLIALRRLRARARWRRSRRARPSATQRLAPSRAPAADRRNSRRTRR
jgi:secreted trypsin-like serine protease